MDIGPVRQLGRNLGGEFCRQWDTELGISADHLVSNMPLRPRPDQSRLRLAAANLKRCPLCGAVNARQNFECFACSWHGAFDRDPHTVEEGLSQLIERCPELASTTNLPSKKPTLWDWFAGLFRRRIDYQA